MRRLFAAVAAMFLVVVAVAPVLAGGKPAHYLLADFSFSYPAGLTCPFEVGMAVDARSLREIDFPVQANGDEVHRIVGAASVTATNRATGKSVTVATNGRQNLTRHADGSFDIQITGGVVAGYFPTDPGGPALLYFVGHLHDTADAGFNLLTHQASGTVRDLCAELSA